MIPPLPFLISQSMSKAAKVISDAILGIDYETVFVGGVAYTITPPTIERMAGAISCLSELEFTDKPTMKELLMSLGETTAYCRALSWFINGDTSYAGRLAKGTFEEVVDALLVSFDLVSPKTFSTAVSLVKSAGRLAAKSRRL